MDHSKIEHKFLKENQLLGLGFPKQGFVFFRVTGIEEIEYRYEESPRKSNIDMKNLREVSLRIPRKILPGF
jgi:hypothetical protein